jgi:hypothetical protein
VSKAYAVGIGAWDKVAIDYAYQDFPQSDDSQALSRILNDAFTQGQLYLTDQDARPAGSASPTAHLWDVGANALDGLKQVTAVRAAALKRFSADAIPEGAPMATLEDVLVPVYLYHRYQLTAVAKLIGGETYSFDVRGGVGAGPDVVPANQQRQAIRALLDSLQPGALALPDPILRVIPPRPPGYPASEENFTRRTSPAFDALAPAEALAGIVTGLLLEPHRAERMIQDHARDANYPGFVELVDDLFAATWKAPPKSGYDGAIEGTVDSVVLDHLMSLAVDETAPPQVRAVASLKLHELEGWTATAFKSATDEGRRAQLFFAQQQIGRFERDPAAIKIPVPAPPPAGDPIGADAWE